MLRGAAAGRATEDYTIEWVKPDHQLGPADKLATQPIPVRAAEIVAAFPLRAQLQEFQDKLNLGDTAAVVAEKSSETANEKASPAFRFLSVRVERRTVDARGEPVTKWDAGDIEESYRTNIVLAGGPGQLPAEAPKLRRLCPDGLVMPRLPTMGELLSPPVDEYPRLEEQLPALKTALETAPAVPDACLIRIFDDTIEEGRTYEYRLQVRMANPNYGRPDAAAGVDTKCKELAGGDWYVVPRRLTVPTDLHFLRGATR